MIKIIENKMKCEKCQKELPTLGGKWTSRFTFFCHYLGCEVNLCTDCYEHYEKALKVFEHEFLTGSPRECATMQLNFNKEDMKELCDRIVEQIRNGELQLVERPNEWIPIKTRPMNDEEKKKANEYFGIPYEDLEWPDAWHYDCPLPQVKDDECVDVLVTTKQGCVVATSYSKDCFGSASFENVEYPDEITAWAFMPKPYKEEGGSDADS